MASESSASGPVPGVLDQERFEEFDLRVLPAVLKAATRIEVEGDEVLRRAHAGFRLAEFDVLAFTYAAGSIGRRS